MDGVDIIAASFGPLTLHATLTVPFEPELRDELMALTLPDDNEIDRMGKADVALAQMIGQGINELIEKNNLDRTQIKAIGSHGQTIRHRPEHGFTLQIGDPNIITEITQLPVVSDFRRRDMAAGGQGAPLVPAFHQALFQHNSIHRVILNLGGIANVSMLPANNLNGVYGFDTGPANILMDAWCHRHTGHPYDENGDWAAYGNPIRSLLDRLQNHEFFAKEPPKSTGREDFNLAWLQSELQKFDQASAHIRYSSADVQATLTELTAMSASMQINMFIKAKENSSVYVCGGGALNDYLMTRLQAHLPHCKVETTASLGLNPAWVEAVAFAWLARQTLMGETGNLPAVTGASKGVVLGQVCFA